jgi:hypothetical protein
MKNFSTSWRWGTIKQRVCKKDEGGFKSVCIDTTVDTMSEVRTLFRTVNPPFNPSPRYDETHPTSNEPIKDVDASKMDDADLRLLACTTPLPSYMLGNYAYSTHAAVAHVYILAIGGKRG